MDIRYGQTGPSLRQEQRNRLAPSHSLCQAVCQQPLRSAYSWWGFNQISPSLHREFREHQVLPGIYRMLFEPPQPVREPRTPSRNTSFVFGVRRMVLLLREKEKDTRLD